MEEEIKEIRCDCGGKIIFIETPDLVHYGKMICQNCNRFYRWIANPNKGVYRKTSIKNHIPLEQCSFCGRTKDQLGIKETMEADHIRELSESQKEEDLDRVENLIALCTACHKLKNWTRLYLNKHQNGKEK